MTGPCETFKALRSPAECALCNNIIPADADRAAEELTCYDEGFAAQYVIRICAACQPLWNIYLDGYHSPYPCHHEFQLVMEDIDYCVRNDEWECKADWDAYPMLPTLVAAWSERKGNLTQAEWGAKVKAVTDYYRKKRA